MLRIPVAASFDLTYNCNLKCSHCYVCKEKSKELNLEEIKKVLDQLAKVGTMLVCFSGGEVFTRKDIFDILEYAKYKEFYIVIITNLNLVDKEAIDKLAESNVNSIETSIYGADSDTHDSITGINGSFNKTVNSINLILKKKIKVKIKYVVMRENFRQYHKIREKFTAMGCEFEFNVGIGKKINGDRSPLKHMLTDQEMIEFYKSIKEKTQEIEITGLCGWNDVHPCGVGIRTISIDPYGNAFPCQGIKFIKVGNAKESTISKLWNSKVMLELSNFKNKEMVECNDCDNKYYCSRCIGRNKCSTKDLYKKDEIACKIANATNHIRRADKHLN